MKNKFRGTPGKWNLDGYIVKMVEAPQASVAICTGFNQDTNGKLLAAAPDMLEALKEILEGKGSYDTDQLKHASNCISDMKTIAQKAINKALLNI